MLIVLKIINDLFFQEENSQASGNQPSTSQVPGKQVSTS